MERSKFVFGSTKERLWHGLRPLLMQMSFYTIGLTRKQWEIDIRNGVCAEPNQTMSSP